ncbi:MAG: hypothetical protein AW09_004297 [Candidatus Accumulibacter phosphatis]|uniref:Uncharacterized protein n=1 Tax=Candidatus Accumulibacter phosphatis TaxID=327160 RepID=A0A080LR71_9PROT|nr:MAG: hypothetical protein AW09_004297 [Candidatus Accumulibacter phosphatis]
MQLGIEQQIDNGHQRGDDEDEDRDANLVRDQVAQRCDGNIGDGHDDDCRQRQHHAVDQIGGHGEQGAEAQDLHQAGILVPDTVGTDLAEFFTTDHFSPPALAAKSCWRFSAT